MSMTLFVGAAEREHEHPSVPAAREEERAAAQRPPGRWRAGQRLEPVEVLRRPTRRSSTVSARVSVHTE